MARGGGRPTVESSLTLDIRHLMRTGPGNSALRTGTLQWTWTSGSPACQVPYELRLDEATGLLHLANVRCIDPFGRPIRLPSQTIQLATTVPPYGGRRWWFLCPKTGHQVMKLHLPYGAYVFASRQAHRLSYVVQRESPLDQAFRRAGKARAQIGGGPNLFEKLPAKPKWMRWRTYWHHVDAYRRAEQKTFGLLVASAERILGGL